MTEMEKLPKPVLKENDPAAKVLIWTASIIIFIGIAFLAKVRLELHPGFDPHVFATANAIINSIVALLLVAALAAVKAKKYQVHKKLMMTAILLSILFLISYVSHHLLTGDTKYGDLNHDGILSAEERSLAGSMRYVYYAILITHIPLAGIILPFILFTAYRALTGNYARHKKLARITWPIWFYVAVSGVVVYLMISRYYQ